MNLRHSEAQKLMRELAFEALTAGKELDWWFTEEAPSPPDIEGCQSGTKA